MPPRLTAILKSRPTKSSREMSEAESREETTEAIEKENPENPSPRRRRRKLLRRLPSKRLKSSPLPSVRTEEEETVRDNSDLLF